MSSRIKKLLDMLFCKQANLDHYEGAPPPVEAEQAAPAAEAEQAETDFENLKTRKAIIWKPVNHFNEDAYYHPEVVWSSYKSTSYPTEEDFRKNIVSIEAPQPVLQGARQSLTAAL